MQHYISVCRLSLAWVTSENSTKQLECRHLDSSSSLDLILSATGLRSPVLTAPVRGSTPTLCCPVVNCSQLLSPANSHSRPRTTSGYGEISGPRISCLVSRQNRQRNRLPWRETHIVLHWWQHPTKHQLYGHLPPITKTLQVRRTRHAGHCWKSKDDVILWTPAYGQAKAGRPARTYIQQLCEDTGCIPEDLPEAMNDREKWRERVRDIFASSTT